MFYAGYRYVGPAFCQDVQQIYLKRHGDKEWSLIFYFQGLSWELDRFSADELLSKLDEHQVEVVIDYDSLEAMGWRDPDRDNVEDFELTVQNVDATDFDAVQGGSNVTLDFNTVV